MILEKKAITADAIWHLHQGKG